MVRVGTRASLELAGVGRVRPLGVLYGGQTDPELTRALGQAEREQRYQPIRAALYRQRLDEPGLAARKKLQSASPGVETRIRKFS
jgi:hypothetical protein